MLFMIIHAFTSPNYTHISMFPSSLFTYVILQYK